MVVSSCTYASVVKRELQKPSFKGEEDLPSQRTKLGRSSQFLKQFQYKKFMKHGPGIKGDGRILGGLEERNGSFSC